MHAGAGQDRTTLKNTALLLVGQETSMFSLYCNASGLNLLGLKLAPSTAILYAGSACSKLASYIQEWDGMGQGNPRKYITISGTGQT